MNTNAITATTGAGLNINPRPEDEADTPKSDNGLSSDFETFLRMLTVQLKNQDPLNPVEASDYAVQLATFSGVEQQVKTNDLLGALGDKLNLMGLSQFANWVGMEARYTGPAAFSGTPVDYVAKPDPAADAAFLVVRNASDTIIDRRPIPVAGGELTWSGTDANGVTYPAGDYSFFVESSSNGTVTDTQPAEVFGTVAEAVVVDGETLIAMTGGQRIAASDVGGLRAPGT